MSLSRTTNLDGFKLKPIRIKRPRLRFGKRRQSGALIVAQPTQQPAAVVVTRPAGRRRPPPRFGGTTEQKIAAYNAWMAKNRPGTPVLTGKPWGKKKMVVTPTIMKEGVVLQPGGVPLIGKRGYLPPNVPPVEEKKILGLTYPQAGLAALVVIGGGIALSQMK